MRRLLGPLLVLAASMAAPTAAGAAGSPFDLIPRNLSAPGQDANYPQIATAPSGTSTITWTRSDGSNSIVQAVRINADGYSGPVLSLSAPGQDAYNPQVSTSANGTTTVIWARVAGVNGTVQATRIDAKGRKGAILNVSAPGPDTYFPQVATSPNGTSTIVWRRTSAGKSTVQASRIDGRGRRGPILNLSDPKRESDNPEVAASANGTSTITWATFDRPRYIVQAMRIDAKGKRGRVLDLSVPDQNATFQQLSFHPVATSPDGASTIAWMSLLAGGKYLVRATRIDARGKKGPVINLSAPDQDAFFPQVAVSPNGMSTVIWERINGANSIVQAARIDTKSKRGRVLNLSAPGWIESSNVGIAVLAASPNGATTITWQRHDGSNSIVQAARIDPSGWLSPVLDLSAPGQNAFNPHVATSSKGTSTITWARAGGPGMVIQALLLR